MPAAVRDRCAWANSGASITIDPAGGAHVVGGDSLTYQAGDVLVLFVAGYGSPGSLGAPSGSDLTWELQASDSIIGSFSATDAVKVYTAVADASITSFTVDNGATDSIGAVIVAVSGADTSNPVDAVLTAKDTFNDVGNPTAPSISPTGTDSLLLCHCAVWPSTDSTSSFSPPSGMTEEADFESGWDSYSVASLSLSASGATGAKAFSESPELAGTSTIAWIAVAIAIRSASAAPTHSRTITRVVSTHTG